jgi:hypothetical protein
MSFESTFLGNAVDNINAQSTLGNKIKTLINAHTGKVTGLNFFNDVPKFGVQVGFQNLGNPLTVAGITMLAAGVVGRRLNIPYAGRLKSIGGKIAFPAAIGSIFVGDAGTGYITQTPSLIQSVSSTGSTI